MLNSHFPVKWFGSLRSAFVTRSMPCQSFFCKVFNLNSMSAIF